MFSKSISYFSIKVNPSSYFSRLPLVSKRDVIRSISCVGSEELEKRVSDFTNSLKDLGKCASR